MRQSEDLLPRTHIPDRTASALLTGLVCNWSKSSVLVATCRGPRRRPLGAAGLCGARAHRGCRLAWLHLGAGEHRSTISWEERGISDVGRNIVLIKLNLVPVAKYVLNMLGYVWEIMPIFINWLTPLPLSWILFAQEEWLHR